MLSFKDAVRQMWRDLRSQKLRTALTVFGIVWGTVSVTLLLAFGKGLERQMILNTAGLGDQICIAWPGLTSIPFEGLGKGRKIRLNEDDVEAIRKELSSVRAAAPSLRTVAQVISANQNWSTAIQGSTPEYFTIRAWSMASGAQFTDADVAGATKVAVLGKTVAVNLFGAQDPVGQIIRIRNVPFKVVGVLAPKGQSAMGQDQDDAIIMPFSTLQKRILGVTYVGAIMVSAASPEEGPVAQDQVQRLLRQRHHIPAGQDDDFTVRNMADIAAAAEASSRVMTMLLGSIASVSLVVGGIGIMNIMLVSVTERTREIGIRMAVGARGRDILLQFLVEAVVLSLAGGLLGVVFGLVGSQVISAMVHWPTIISLSSILLAFLFSIAIGVFFGLYPARRAAGLNPIEALRYE